jgi:hypothetical protein
MKGGGGGGGGDSSTLIVHKQKQFDSNDFNYWFECSSITSGVIKFDLTLDKGNPLEQVKFLKMHDAKQRRLYFLWSQDTDSKEEAKCGCSGGGCYYYSVFPSAENFEFFNLEKSISRTNPLYGESLFRPGVHILQSEPMMRTKYPTEVYNYDKMPSDEQTEMVAVESGISMNRKTSRATVKSFHKSISSISEVKIGYIFCFYYTDQLVLSN